MKKIVAKKALLVLMIVMMMVSSIIITSASTAWNATVSVYGFSAIKLSNGYAYKGSASNYTMCATNSSIVNYNAGQSIDGNYYYRVSSTSTDTFHRYDTDMSTGSPYTATSSTNIDGSGVSASQIIQSGTRLIITYKAYCPYPSLTLYTKADQTVAWDGIS